MKLHYEKSFEEWWNEHGKKLYDIPEDVARAMFSAGFDELAARVEDAIDHIVAYGGIDGDDHKDWCLDQTVRLLANDEYNEVVREAMDGEDGPETYYWEIGIAP